MKKIFNYLLLSAAAMTAMLAVSCDPTEQEDPTTEEPSQEQLVVPEGELIAFEIKNMTAYSLDVNVAMSDDCERYCVTAFMNGSYDEKRFIESAQNSINADPSVSYSYQPFNVFTENKLVPESLLSKGTHPTSTESNGIILTRGSSTSAGGELTLTPYQIAIYAEDAEGNYKVYTSEEFTLPEPQFNSTPTVKITPAEITMRSISATFEAEGDCAKIIRGFCLPNENNIIDWDSASDDEIVNVLKDLAMTNTPYYWTGTPFTEEVPKDLTPGLTVYVYAAAITADGKIGKLCYEKMVSETPSLEGTGTVDVDFVEEEPLGTFRFAVELGNGATAARIIACDNSTYAKIQNDMDWVFTDPEQSYLWVEVTADELAANEGIVEIADRAQGTKYYVFAVAISEDGVSPVATFEEVTSKKEEVVIEKINYDLGIGKANIEATSTTYRIPGVDYGTWQEPDTYLIDVTYTITKGENTEKVYLISCQNVVNDDIESIKAIVASYLETEEDYKLSTVSEITESEFGVPALRQNFDIYYNPALVVITVDTAGNYAVADYYIVEYDEEGAIERPTE